MNLKIILPFCLFFILNFLQLTAAQQQISAVRITNAPKIDGVSDDPEWNKVPVAFSGRFTQLVPDNLEPSAYKTELKIAYNDFAFYVMARMSDPDPQSIPRELGLRDQWGKNTDLFAFVLDTYNKGQNAFYFGVTAAGVQLDSYMTPQVEDRAWDAVWKSAVTINEEGWVAEFEIPYSAIRFSKAEVQDWAVNFIREVKRDNEESTWNPVDRSISGFVNQSGIMEGIRDVNPPVRLQFFPYVSSVVGHNGETGNFRSTVGGGMDVKYGINESFTLDMALIPDFSQVQSDNVVLNLGPYEVKYAENRPFFTEGTDLFNKGGLFYSRRVGQLAHAFDAEGQMKANEEIVRRPAETQLINAAKVSGRTQKGLGIGFFNAVTDKSYMEVQDQETGERRQIMMDPLTNFNVMVLDQNLKYNSNISLINTNVSRWEGGRNANVTATDFRLHDKKNMFRLEGFGAYNHINSSRQADGSRDLVQGYKYYLRLRKVSGNFRYGLSRNVESDAYDINDMGYIQAANEVSHRLYSSYHIFKPFWFFNRFSYNLRVDYSQLYAPREYAGFGINNDYSVQLKNFWSTGGWFGLKPVDTYDFFEPRAEGYYFTRKPSYDGGVWVQSDSRKRLAVYGQYGMFRRHEWDSKDYWFTVSPRYRVSNSFSFSHNINASRRLNERGYVDVLDDATIVFGNREVRNLENVSNFNFIFNNKMGLSLRVRHYWSRVGYDRYFELGKDGELSAIAYDGLDERGESMYSTNFNAFNLDLVYQWQIAPGSFLTFAWKDAIYDSNEHIRLNFGENMRELSQVPQHNTVSLKLTYFVDYLMFKKLIPMQWKDPVPNNVIVRNDIQHNRS